MTAEDKLKIFNLLKTADSHINGYVKEQFMTPPEFCDDLTSAPAPQEKSGLTLEDLNSKIQRCTRCSLARTRTAVISGNGPENPKVLLIGEAPTQDDSNQLKPFSGNDGILLDKMLDAIGLNRNTNCYLTNAVKCHTTENRSPYPDEVETCKGFLQTQIHILKPKMILCMGKLSAEKLLDQKLSVEENHGQFFDYNGIPLMLTYTPNQLLQNQSLKRPAWDDLKAFKNKMDSIN